MYNLVLDDFQLGLIQTALGEKEWSCKNTKAGQNYREVINYIKKSVKEQ